MPRTKTLTWRICPKCGKHYQATAQNIAQAKRRGRETYCSTPCSYAARRTRNITRQERVCIRCGKAFFATPSRIKRRVAVYCSRACHNPRTTAVCETCGVSFKCFPSAKARFCSKKCAYASPGRSDQMRAKAIEQWKTKRPEMMTALRRRSDTEEWKAAAHFQTGEKHPKWKGNKRSRQANYVLKKWRMDVLKRDSFTCQHCFTTKNVTLSAHHIKPWAEFPELRYDVANGQTLCWPCHAILHGKAPMPWTRACLHCGQRFLLKKRRAKFCSFSCSRRYVVAEKRRRQANGTLF